MANSLGTLTLDLVAKIGAFTGPLDKASQEAKKRNAEISKSFEGLAKGVGAAISSIPVILGAMVVSSANAAKEISNLSSLAGLSTTEFQKLSAGARSVGVDQDKLADIFKDTNDKIGDFINTGGGALKDFFTNIAPMVGVTADQFKKLNSKDALALYVTSLEKANVSQAEMTFYMEAIANDSTALVPLLRNNAKGFDDLGAAAEATGVILSSSTIASAKQFGIEIQGVEQFLSSAKTQLAAEFLPLLAQFSKDVNQATKDVGGLGPAVKKTTETAIESIAFIVDAGDTVGRVFRVISAEFDGLVSSAAGSIIAGVYQTLNLLNKLPGVDLSSQLGGLEQNYNEQVNAATDATNRMRAALEDPLVGSAFVDYYKKANAAAEELNRTQQRNQRQGVGEGAGSGVDPAAIAAAAAAKKKATAEALAATKKLASEAAAAAKKIQDSFENTETDYKRQIELINTTNDKRKDATEVAKLQFEVESGKLVGINDLQQKRLASLAAELDSLKKIKQANEDAAKLAAFTANLDQSNQTTKDGFAQELAGAGRGDEYKERLKQFLSIRQDFNAQMRELQEQQQNESSAISPELYEKEKAALIKAQDEKLDIQKKYYDSVDAAQDEWMDGVTSAWENYVDQAKDYSGQAEEFVSGSLNDLTSGLAGFFSDVATGSESAGDAVADFAANMGKSVINALSQMAAQWLVYQAVQLLVGTTTKGAGAAAMTANAIATSAQASLAAFASTAAIPIVGPAAAPAAAIAASAATAPMVAAVTSAALAGMAHDGIDSVPQTGTWLLQKGERVTTAETSAKLDKTLSDIATSKTPSGRGGDIYQFSFPGVTDEKTGKMAGAAAARQMTRTLRQAGRYS